jgi:hypothetical protein
VQYKSNAIREEKRREDEIKEDKKENKINTKADVISTDQWGNEIDVNGFHIKTKKK